MSLASLAEPSLGASSFRSVPDMWHHRVDSTPGSQAMIFRRGTSWESLTWSEAGERVRAIANGLLAFGLRPEERCCLIASTRVEWILADLAILCAGGATTTVYPDTLPPDCAYIVDHCEAVLVFAENATHVETLRACRDQIGRVQRVVVFDGQSSEDGWVQSLEDFEEAGRAWAVDHPDAYREATRSVDPGHLATLMYTSGTTGTPKGVMLTHDAWIYEAEAIDALGFMTPADVQFLFLPLSHVFAKVLQMCFIRLGIPTVVDGSVDDLMANLEHTRPTWLAAVPRVFEKMQASILRQARGQSRLSAAVFDWAVKVGRQVSAVRQRGESPRGLLKARHALAERLVFNKVKRRFGGRLRWMISGGAPLSAEIAQLLHACDLLVLEGYGLTESAAASCVNRPNDFQFGTVGPPLPGCSIRIAEDGEILLRSRGVMRGYYKNEEATAAVLTDDGWLRTGDIGVLLESGHLRITDRKKDLIVTAGGKNIAPAHAQNLLKARCAHVSHVVMHGDRRPYCVALVTIDERAAGRWARDQHIPFSDYDDLTRRPELRAAVQACVDDVNRELPAYERIARFAILSEELTQENGMLTPSLKVRRGAVEARFSDVLARMYAATAP